MLGVLDQALDSPSCWKEADLEPVDGAAKLGHEWTFQLAPIAQDVVLDPELRVGDEIGVCTPHSMEADGVFLIDCDPDISHHTWGELRRVDRHVLPFTRSGWDLNPQSGSGWI